MRASSRLAGRAVAVVFTTAQTASADATFRTWGSDVNVREDAKVSSKSVHVLPGPTDIAVDCQKQGDVVTDGAASSAWWAHVPALGGYVSVVYVDIPENKLPGVRECSTTPPPPPPRPDRT